MMAFAGWVKNAFDVSPLPNISFFQGSFSTLYLMDGEGLFNMQAIQYVVLCPLDEINVGALHCMYVVALKWN